MKSLSMPSPYHHRKKPVVHKTEDIEDIDITHIIRIINYHIEAGYFIDKNNVALFIEGGCRAIPAESVVEDFYQATQKYSQSTKKLIELPEKEDSINKNTSFESEKDARKLHVAKMLTKILPADNSKATKKSVKSASGSGKARRRSFRGCFSR